MPRLSTSRDLRRTNRTAILRTLLFGGPSSRQALVEATGLSAATVGLVVADLLDDRLVVEVGNQESSGGRPRTIVQAATDRAVTVGVDVGERGLRVEAYDLTWHRRSELFVDINAGSEAPASVVARIASAVEAVAADAAMPEARLLGVGVSVPGIVTRSDAAEVHAPGFGWDGVPLGHLLREAITAPVVVDNGAKTMGQAEMWFGAGRGAKDAVVALLGIGVGAAVFTDGALYRGSQSSAGEWGHTPIVVDGDPCRCGSHGCLEAYIGESAIIRRWEQVARDSAPTRESDLVRIAKLFARADDDPDAAEVVDHVARHLGAGLATLINLFNPQRIVLAGSVGLRITPTILDRVRSAARRYSLSQPFESVKIVQGTLGDDAVALGAATLVVDGLLAAGFPVPEPARAAVAR